MLELMRHSTFAGLYAAQVVALCGTGMLTVALGLLAYSLADERAGVVLGVALTIKMVAYVVICPLATALVSRVPVKAVLVAADIVRAAAALCLPFVTEIWQIYALIVVLQAASATFTPTFQALIPVVLPDEQQYVRAVSLSRISYDLEALISPLIVALLLTFAGEQDLFWGTGAGFVFSALLVMWSRLPKIDPPPAERFWPRLTKGLRIFAGTESLRVLAVLNVAVAAATSMVIINSVLVVQGVFGLSQQHVAVQFAAFGLGSLVVALVMPCLAGSFSDRQVMLAGAAALTCGLVLAAVSLSLGRTSLVSAATSSIPMWLLSLAAWAVMGGGASAVLTSSARVIRSSVPSSEYPTVFAAQFSLSHACFLVTYPLAGFLAPTWGVGVSAWVLCLLAGAATAVAAARRQPVAESLVLSR